MFCLAVFLLLSAQYSTLHSSSINIQWIYWKCISTEIVTTLQLWRYKWSVSWWTGSTALSILSKMEASPLPFSDCYLNSHVNAALKLGSQAPLQVHLWRQSISVTATGRCASTSCVTVEPTAVPLLKETTVHPPRSREKIARDDADISKQWQKHSGHDSHPLGVWGWEQQAAVRHQLPSWPELLFYLKL